VIEPALGAGAGAPEGAPAGGPAAPRAAIVWARRIEQVLDVVLGVMLIAVAATLFYQVFGRYVIGRAPAWTEELARMLVAWMAMLGTAACLRTGGHIAVGALVDAVPPRVRVVLLGLRDAAMMATAGVLGWAGTRFAVMNGAQESAAMEIPMSVPYSAMCVGAVLMAIVLALVRLGGETPPVDAALHSE
jgi:TRAP-type C4-dicarboxylate transport system permease small subunit